MKTFAPVILLAGWTGVAAAQPRPAEAKPPIPKPAETKPAEAKPPTPKPAETKPSGAESRPPAEIAEIAKGAVGSWRCKGQGMDHTMKMIDMAATMKVRLDVAGWWLHGTFEAKIGKEPFGFESYTTYDAKAKKWKRIMVESGGAWNNGESDGPVNNKIDWEFTTHSPTMGEGMFRDHEDVSDPKVGVKMWGEFSPDKGKTWVKAYEMACKK